MSHSFVDMQEEVTLMKNLTSAYCADTVRGDCWAVVTFVEQVWCNCYTLGKILPRLG